MKRAYVGFIMAQHRGFVAFAMFVAAALQYLIITIVSDVDTAAVFEGMFAQLPARFQMLINDFICEGKLQRNDRPKGFTVRYEPTINDV